MFQFRRDNEEGKKEKKSEKVLALGVLDCDGARSRGGGEL
jgi:hypothetical protein